MFLRSSDLGEGGEESAGTPTRGMTSSGSFRGYGSPSGRGSYGRHSYGASRPATTAATFGGARSAPAAEEEERPSSTGGLGLAGALPATETRRSMLERQRELQRKRRAARRPGGLMATSRDISGPDGPRSPLANPQVTRSIPQFSAPKAFSSPRDDDAGGKRRESDSRGLSVDAGSVSTGFASGPSTPGSMSGLSLQEVIREREKAKRDARSRGPSSPLRSMTGVERDMAAKGISSSYDPGVGHRTRQEAKAAEQTTPNLRDMPKFLTTPTPRSCGIVQCYIKRNKGGMNKLYPLYQLFLDDDSFLLSGKKRAKQRTSNYLITSSRTDMSRTSEHFLGKLRGNPSGTHFTVYDTGANPKDVEERAAKAGVIHLREELAMVIYTPNKPGEKGPRKMKVCVPRVDVGTNKRKQFQPQSEESLMLKAAEREDARLIHMINKPPKWNESVGAYVLNFNGRVTMASVKNFQMVDPEDPDNVLLQFGRVGKDLFTMDFQWPLCPLQAFAIALSSFDYKVD